MTADPVAIARDLLRCPSVTPAEGGALKFLEGVLKAAGFTVFRMTFREPGADDVENLYARIGTAAPNLVFAGHTDVVPPGDEKAWKHPPFAGEVANGQLYGRGAVDMKGGIACALAAVLDHLAANGGKPQKERLDLVPDHRRRGRHRGQRHAQAVEMGGRARRKIRSLHPGRAEQPGRARRHHQDRPPRLAQRPSDRARPARPCRLSAARRQSDPRAGDAGSGAAGRAARRRQRAIFRRRIWNSPRSMSATRPSISFPARRGRASTSASTTCHTLDSLKKLIEQRAAKAAQDLAAGGKIKFAFQWEPSNAGVFVTKPGPFTELVASAVAEGHRPQAGTVHHRRHLGRALHHRLLSGGGIRPGRADHACGRRARADRRPARADDDLSEDHRPVFRLTRHSGTR